MCLILFAKEAHPDYPLVFAGNRDEFYDRPTAPAEFWDDAPHVLGGRDLKAGGTWLGVTRSGHWATVTNVRDPGSHQADAPSRGGLVAEYLKHEPPLESYIQSVADKADQYNGFNLLVGTPTEAFYFSNRDGPFRSIDPGVHGISNAQLNDPWPKVERGTSNLRGVLNEEVTVDRLLHILDDRQPAPDEDLPDTGIRLEKERMLSAPFIEGESYGTRSSTVLLFDQSGRCTFVERTFEDGEEEETRRFEFEVSPAA